MLAVRNLQIWKEGVDWEAIFSERIDFVIPAPGVYLLEGDNQSGKSTLIKTMMGVYSAAGAAPVRISLADKVYRLRSPHDAQRAGLAAVFQDDQLIPTFTVMEQYVLLFADSPLAAMFKRSRSSTEVQLDATRLVQSYGAQYKAILHKKPTELSGGALAVARLVKAQLGEGIKVLFLDEAFSAVQREVWPELITSLRLWQEEGERAVVVVSHNPDEKARWDARGTFQITDQNLIYRPAAAA